MLLNHKIASYIIILKLLLISFVPVANSDDDFNVWLLSYKQFALKKGVSRETIDIAFKNVKFLAQVIKYDRKQPEFYEDTITYVNKRANLSRVETAKNLFSTSVNKVLFFLNNFFAVLTLEMFALLFTYVIVSS